MPAQVNISRETSNKGRLRARLYSYLINPDGVVVQLVNFYLMRPGRHPGMRLACLDKSISDAQPLDFYNVVANWQQSPEPDIREIGLPLNHIAALRQAVIRSQPPHCSA